MTSVQLRRPEQVLMQQNNTLTSLCFMYASMHLLRVGYPAAKEARIEEPMLITFNYHALDRMRLGYGWIIAIRLGPHCSAQERIGTNEKYAEQIYHVQNRKDVRRSFVSRLFGGE